MGPRRSAGRCRPPGRLAGFGGESAATGRDPALEAVRWRLDDDLDTPGALAELDERAAVGQPVAAAAALLGVSL